MMSGEEHSCDYQELVTRAQSYFKAADEAVSSSTTGTKSKTPFTRNELFMKCKDHFKLKKKDEVWNAESKNCHECVKFSLSSTLPNGHLPTHNQVLEYFLYARSIDRGNQSSFATRTVAIDIDLHWIYCNFYTISLKRLTKRRTDLFSEYNYLKNFPASKKGTA